MAKCLKFGGKSLPPGSMTHYYDRSHVLVNQDGDVIQGQFAMKHAFPGDIVPCDEIDNLDDLVARGFGEIIDAEPPKKIETHTGPKIRPLPDK